ncbi:hypothetical protein HDU96_009113 [Phlyctochytrium bullatum]|nr:hypothetical protein HDU96_009113 [Phlyctochytrium bullatum]
MKPPGQRSPGGRGDRVLDLTSLAFAYLLAVFEPLCLLVFVCFIVFEIVTVAAFVEQAIVGTHAATAAFFEGRLPVMWAAMALHLVDWSLTSVALNPPIVKTRHWIVSLANHGVSVWAKRAFTVLVSRATFMAMCVALIPPGALSVLLHVYMNGFCSFPANLLGNIFFRPGEGSFRENMPIIIRASLAAFVAANVSGTAYWLTIAVNSLHLGPGGEVLKGVIYSTVRIVASATMKYFTLSAQNMQKQAVFDAFHSRNTGKHLRPGDHLQHRRFFRDPAIVDREELAEIGFSAIPHILSSFYHVPIWYVAFMSPGDTFFSYVASSTAIDVIFRAVINRYKRKVRMLEIVNTISEEKEGQLEAALESGTLGAQSALPTFSSLPVFPAAGGGKSCASVVRPSALEKSIAELEAVLAHPPSPAPVPPLPLPQTLSSPPGPPETPPPPTPVTETPPMLPPETPQPPDPPQSQPPAAPSRAGTGRRPFRRVSLTRGQTEYASSRRRPPPSLDTEPMSHSTDDVLASDAVEYQSALVSQGTMGARRKASVKTQRSSGAGAAGGGEVSISRRPSRQHSVVTSPRVSAAAVARQQEEVRELEERAIGTTATPASVGGVAPMLAAPLRQLDLISDRATEAVARTSMTMARYLRGGPQSKRLADMALKESGEMWASRVSLAGFAGQREAEQLRMEGGSREGEMQGVGVASANAECVARWEAELAVNPSPPEANGIISTAAEEHPSDVTATTPPPASLPVSPPADLELRNFLLDEAVAFAAETLGNYLSIAITALVGTTFFAADALFPTQGSLQECARGLTKLDFVVRAAQVTALRVLADALLLYAGRSYGLPYHLAVMRFSLSQVLGIAFLAATHACLLVVAFRGAAHERAGTERGVKRKRQKAATTNPPPAKPTAAAATFQQKKRLEELEGLIKEHLGSGKFFLVAAALREIDDSKLYMPEEKNIYTYAWNKFAFNRRTTNTYICSASVYASIAEDPTLPVPVNISHVRALHKYPAETRRQIWANVCKANQPITEEFVLSVTAKTVSGGTFSHLPSEIYTPKHIIEKAKLLIGKDRFDLDPASCSYANDLHQNKLAEVFYDEDADGLKQPWHGDVWLSPPVGDDASGVLQQAKWFFNAEERYYRKEVNSICILLKVDLGKTWFIRALSYPHCFFHHKVMFSVPMGKVKVHEEESYVLVYMGPKVDEFCTQFEKLGTIPGVNSWHKQGNSVAAAEHANLQLALQELKTDYYLAHSFKVVKPGQNAAVESPAIDPEAEEEVEEAEEAPEASANEHAATDDSESSDSPPPAPRRRTRRLRSSRRVTLSLADMDAEVDSGDDDNSLETDIRPAEEPQRKKRRSGAAASARATRRTRTSTTTLRQTNAPSGNIADLAMSPATSAENINQLGSFGMPPAGDNTSTLDILSELDLSPPPGIHGTVRNSAARDARQNQTAQIPLMQNTLVASALSSNEDEGWLDFPWAAEIVASGQPQSGQQQQLLLDIQRLKNLEVAKMSGVQQRTAEPMIDLGF